MIFEDQTRVLRRCLFDVHNEVGVGYPEEAYHRAFITCCQKRGIPLSSKKLGRLMHRGIRVHTFQYDVLADDTVMLELKARASEFARDDHVQTISYLKFWRKSLALLVNFGQEKVKVERVPFSEKELLIDEHYEYIEPLLIGGLRRLFESVRDGILEVGRVHGLGYGDSVCAKLLAAEWRHRQLGVQLSLVSAAKFEDHELGLFPLDAVVVGEKILCCLVALKDGIGPYELGKTQTYLRASNLPIGLAINFGKRSHQIRGVRPPRH